MTSTNGTNSSFIIAIDGPAGSGKGTTAKEVAKRLNFKYLDTGAIYRAITLYLTTSNIASDSKDMDQILKSVNIEFRVDNAGDTKIYLNGEDVNIEIRTNEVSNATPIYANNPVIRDFVRNIQHAQAKDSNIVVEGRDTTTEIFPDAPLKVYLYARLPTRAARRHLGIGSPESPTVSEIEEQLRIRDENDQNRKDGMGKLYIADGAKLLGTTDLTIEEQVQQVIDWYHEVCEQNQPGHTST